MQRPNPEIVPLNDILITQELSRRAPRSPNWQAEAEAMRSLIHQMARGSQSLMQTLVDTAMKLCQAGTAGVSLLETTPDGEEIFRWTVLAGTLAHHVGETSPCNFSPCGVCLKQGSPVLFSHPEHYFTYFQEENTPIVEGLVLPLVAECHVFGTIWIMSHDEGRQFDSEDVRVMTSLADFSATALLLQQRQTGELLAANAALETEIVERKQAEEQTQALIANLPGGAAFVVDRDLRYLLAEGEALSVAGFKPADLVGRTIFEALPPDLAASYEPLYRQALAGKPFEHEHSAHNHTYISRGTPLRAEDGEIYAVLVVSYDISERQAALRERKQAEQAPRESEARLQSIANLVPDLLWDSKPDGSTNWYNQRWMEYTGQTFEQAIGWGWTDAIHPDDQEEEGSARRYREAVEQGMLLQQEHRIRRHDGAYRWFVVKASPLRDESGKVIKMYGAATDIHEQRVALEALRQSEAKYRSLFNTVEEGFCSIEVVYNEGGQPIDHQVLEANPAFERHTGLTAVQGKLASEVMPGIEQFWNDLYARVVATGESERLEQYSPAFDRWFDVEISRVGDESLRRVALIFQDITDRKQAEAQLHRAAEMDAFRVKLSDTLRSLSDPEEIKYQAACVLGEHLGSDRAYYVEIDEAHSEFVVARDWHQPGAPSHARRYPLSGWPMPWLVDGQPWVVRDVDTDPAMPDDQREAYRGNDIGALIVVPLIKNGQLVATLATNQHTPRNWTTDEITAVQETAERTWAAVERAYAEAALRESEEKYRSLFTTMDQGFCIIEKVETAPGQPSNFRYITVNPAFERHTGLSDVVGKTMRDFVPNAEHHLVDIYDAVVRTGEPQHFEEYVSEVDLWFETEVFPAQLPGQIAVLFSNVSDRKRAELALRESEERLRDVLNSMSEGFALLGGDFTILDVNEETLRLDGRSRHELIGRSHWEAFPGSENSPVGEIFKRVARERRPDSLEHEYYWSDRRSLWIDMRAYPTRDTGVAIFWRDITDRKKTEAALRESEAKYRSLFTSMDEGYFLCEVIFDENHQPVDLFYIDENPAAIRVTGQSFRGRRLREIDPNYEEYWYEIFGRVAQSGQGERLERYAEPDQIWYDFYVFKVGSEESRRVAVVFNDITDRKRSEAQLQRAAERDAFRVKLSDALRSLTDPVQIQAEACRLLGEQLGVDRAFYVEIYEAEGYARVNQHYSRGDSPSIVGDYPLAGYGWSMQIMRRGETIVVADTQSSNLVPDAERAAMAMLQMVGFVALPLIKGEVLVGALTLNEPAPREWTEAEVELVRETAERIWADIQRAHAETALRQSEEKYRTLFDSIDEGLAIVEMIYDDQGEIVDIIYRQVNRAYERHGGVYNVVGRSIFDVIPGVEDYWLDLYKRVAKTGESVREENYQQDVDRWFDVYFSRVDDSGRFVAIVFSDISDRKQRERQQEYLLKLSDTLRPLVEAEEIETSACRVLGEWLGAHRVYYVEIFESEGVGRVSKQYLRNGAASIAGDYPIAAFDWTAQALRRGEAVVVSDVYHSDLVPPESIAAMEAVQQISIVLVPLIKEGKWVGVLTVGKDAPRDWREEDVELVRETLERMWAAAQRARAEAALRELELQRVREQSACEQERQRAEALAELDRAKTVFFSNISHEFRTPLTLLLAPLQDALKSVDEWMSGSVDETPSTHRPIHPSTLKHNLELVHRNSLRLLKLVNTLLDFSRIEAGRRSAVYEPTDLATYTAELASVFRSAIERAGLQLMVDCPPLPEPVFVDREMWEKIVLNLLSNAFKFTFEGEIRVSLRVGAWESGSVDETPSTHQPIHPSTHAILQIQDTGTGITPEHLPHLFERFYQVRGNQARTHEGSGIGLALVNELVRLQGGTIEVSSILGEGTCFTVSLPFGTEHLPSDRLQSEGDRHPIRTLASTAMSATAYVEEAERWLPTLDPPQPPLEGGENLLKVPLNKEDLGGSLGAEADSTSSARVLVVDDNADMREYLTRILSEYVQVEAVADGITALAAAQERVPDLILSDVMMPGLDGFELLEALRADPRTREIPIILLSARAGEEAIVEGLAAGADDYLIKPFSAQELISRIIAHLQMAQLRGEALQEARSTLRSRDEFISVVSHELNTPLVSILGWTRMLRSSLPNPVILSKALDTIERNATLQAKLVQDLLDLSRISAGKLRLNPQPIELKPVIETAIATVSQTAIDKGIHLTRQENVTEPVVVKGDSDRLCQVLINLLTNAIKFTPESGSVTLELSVKCGSVDENPSTHPPIHPSTHPPIHSYAEIRVTDTGDGIPADFLPYVFERFRQAEGAYAAKGLGLGLAIARHIVELHNGTIHAESAGEEQGATFIVRLPLLQKNDDFSGIQPGI